MRLGVDIHFPVTGELATVTHKDLGTFVIVSIPDVRTTMYFNDVASIDALLSALIAARHDMVTIEARKVHEEL